jgi:2-haloacid dehalogenase
MKPDGIVFDMYGTVADLSAVTKACEEVVTDPAEFGSLWRLKQLEYTFLLSLMEDYMDFWQVTESALQFTVETIEAQLTQQQKNLLMRSWLRPQPFQDALAGLRRMKGRYPLAILSNGSPKMLNEGLEYAGLETYFDWVLSVEEVQVFKPSPKVYGLAPTRMGIGKEGILFVSSNSFDVVGAKKYGFRTCWIRRMRGPLDPLGAEPNLVVSGFEELVGLL